MPLATWPSAFLVTVLVELPIVVALTRDIPLPSWRRAAIALVAQFATHPLVWFYFPALVGLAHNESLWLSEGWAWAAEAAIYWLVLPGRRPWRAFGISGIANGLSLGTGIALRALAAG
jgi:hypothetical protein